MTAPTVLHLCSIKGRGGTGYMASRLCRLAAAQGVRILVGACAGSKMEARARDDGLPLLGGLSLRRGFHPRRLAQDVGRIRACLRAAGVDIVHAWHSIEYWTAALATLGTGVALVRTRGLVTPVRNTAVNRWIHGRTALCHVTCRAIAENYRRAGLDRARVRLLYDGVDVARFHPGVDGQGVRAAAGIPAAAVVVASVGRLEPVKGQETLLAAVARLAPELPLHVLVAGDGSCRRALEAQAAALGVGPRVHFLGVRRDIPAVLAASDLYALTSVGSEGSSRATLEAMAAGLPVIASRVGMLPDVVRAGQVGRLVEPRDAAGLAAGLAELAADGEKRRAWGRAARDWAEREFDEQGFAARMVECYRAICAGQALP